MSLSSLVDAIDGLLTNGAPINQVKGQLLILREQVETLDEQVVALSLQSQQDIIDSRIEHLQTRLNEAYEEIERLQAEAAFDRQQKKVILGQSWDAIDGPVSNASASDIIRKIQEAAPFHRQKIEESFRGTRVSWEAKLLSISRHPWGVQVMAIIPGVCCSLCCHSNETACATLAPARDEARIRITGKLKDINETLGDLVDCTFELLEDDDQ